MKFKGLSSPQVVFLASAVAMDFGFGFVMKSALHATGITQFIRVEMIVPTMLLMLARLVVDRFGVCAAYQVAWAALATVAMPGAIASGPLKLLPALLQGLAYDAVFSLLSRHPRGRVYASAIIGGFISTSLMMAARIWLGLPWATATQALFGVQIATSVIVHAIGARLALKIWDRLRETQLAQLIGARA